METDINSEGRLLFAADSAHTQEGLGLLRMTTSSGHMGSWEAAVLPLLVGKQSCNITFVLDTSESSRAALSSLKRLLIQTLLMKASLGDSRFNIITFSDKVHRWSHHMLPCAPNTVYTALSWIHSISCGPGQDLLSALTLALADPACHAVHLLVTNLSDHPQAVWRGLAALAAERPVNAFYLQDSTGGLDHSAAAYLQQLTRATRGSSYAIVQDSNRGLGKVIPLYDTAESRSSLPVQRFCPSSSVLLTQQPHLAPSPVLRSSLDNPAHLLTSCFLSDRSWVHSEVSPGSPVLARSDLDGFYYRGTVIQQVQGLTGVWVVEFEHSAAAGLDTASPQRQLVCSLDMVNLHTGHQTLPLAPGDAILSPWEPSLRRYGPGRVMAITERRGAFTINGVVNLRVLMWHGCVTLLPDHLVLPISNTHYERMTGELRTPTSAHCRWLRARASSGHPRLFCSDCPASPLPCCSLTDHQPRPVPPGGRPGPGATGGSEWTRRGKRRAEDTDEGKSDPELASMTSSPPLSDDETLASFPPVERARSERGRPPWRYWRRSGPEPQHRQPGISLTGRISQPDESRLPVPQSSSSSPNHSSLFLSLPAAKSRGADIRDIFDAKVPPQPPGNSQHMTSVCRLWN